MDGKRLPRRRWHEMTSGDFARGTPGGWVAIMPVGAIEQHGPHLPVGVDAMINNAIIDAMLDLAPDDLPVTVLPTFWIGRSEEHVDFPGTLTFSAETLRRMWFETGASVARAGVRKLIILNSHGGQIQVMQIVARELRIRHDMFVVSCSWPQLGLPEGLVGTHEQRVGIHAGQVETSLMLHIAPHLVDMSKAENFQPVYATRTKEFPILMGLGAAGFGWKAQDLHESGAAGDASVASPEQGAAILGHTSGQLSRLVAEVSRYQPPPSPGEMDMKKP
ncbi:MAG: creatininase family protein [Geminicoccaceae bacterium]|nr:creatininase family protein [Geminicoccaceae bacterium]